MSTDRRAMVILRGIGQGPTHFCGAAHSSMTPEFDPTCMHDSWHASNLRLASQVGSGDAIKDVKAKIQDDEGVPLDEQRPIFACKRREDGRSLSKCQVEPEPTLLRKSARAQIVSNRISFVPMPLTMMLTLLLLALPAMGQLALTDTSIRTAVRDWETNATTAARTYGPIGVWNTAAVGNMAGLFESNWFDWKSKFNANISTWNVARVSNMAKMFDSAKAFNSELAGWNVAV